MDFDSILDDRPSRPKKKPQKTTPSFTQRNAAVHDRSTGYKTTLSQLSSSSSAQFGIRSYAHLNKPTNFRSVDSGQHVETKTEAVKQQRTTTTSNQRSASSSFNKGKSPAVKTKIKSKQRCRICELNPEGILTCSYCNAKVGPSSKHSLSDNNVSSRATNASGKKSSNAWLSKRKDSSNKDIGKTAELKSLHGNIMAILNKMTPDNFKDLCVEMLQLNIDNKEKMEIVVGMIFEKAVLEQMYSQTYASLCKIMGSIKFPEEQNVKVSPFRKTLLNRCQKEFFREKSDEDKLTKRMDELQLLTDVEEKQHHVEELLYQRSKLKEKMLGNINFIGELFNLDMLSSKIILSQCIGNLLAKREEGKLHDEVVECLAELFSTVGLKLENECEDDMKKRAFEKSFSDFKDLGLNANYGCRIRFMIQNVVELRENNWIPRRVEAKPQRIEDIHRQYEKEEQEKKLEAAAAASSWKSKKNATKRGKNRN